MPANVETHGNKAAFVEFAHRNAAGNLQTAWHKLGTVFSDNDSLTTEKALEVAHLSGWNVRVNPMTAPIEVGGETLHLPVPNQFATIRDNPFVPGKMDVLGVVGSYYEPVQNEDHADMLNALVDESNARIETAGSLDEGRKVFITMRMPEDMLIGGEDPVALYLIASNSHDGNSSFSFLVSPIRVVCQNTLSAAFRSAEARFNIRHTKGAKTKIQEAREALSLTWKYAQEFETAAQLLVETEMTDNEFEQIIKGLYPEPDAEKKRARTIWDAKFEALTEIYHEDETQASIKGTRWGGYQAVTRYLDYQAPVSGEKSKEDDGWVDVAKALRITSDDRWEGYKNDAFKAFAAVG